MTTSEIAVANTMCARCEARPGEPCRTISGGRASWPHGARTRAIDEGWNDGYVAGARDALDLLRRYVEWAAVTANPTKDAYDLTLERIRIAERQYGVTA